MPLPASLREQLAADYRAVRVLPSPWVRALWMAPLALLALVAAPLWFNVRVDAPRLGVFGLWGASALQTVVGMLVVVAALRESVPGRSWNGAVLTVWMLTPIVLVSAVTVLSWQASPILLRGGWWTVAAMCFTGSAATALPVVALGSVLAARAYPTRPALAGAMIGLGGGLMADAGWRIFCHFSEPSHVLLAHLAAVIAAAAIGALVAVRLTAGKTRVR